MAGDSPSLILAWDPGLRTQQRNEGQIDVVFAQRLAAMGKEVVRRCPCYPISSRRLAWSTNLFPLVVSSSDHRVHWLLKGIVGHVHRQSENTKRFFRQAL